MNDLLKRWSELERDRCQLIHQPAWYQVRFGGYWFSVNVTPPIKKTTELPPVKDQDRLPVQNIAYLRSAVEEAIAARPQLRVRVENHTQGWAITLLDTETQAIFKKLDPRGAIREAIPVGIALLEVYLEWLSLVRPDEAVMSDAAAIEGGAV